MIIEANRFVRPIFLEGACFETCTQKLRELINKIKEVFWTVLQTIFPCFNFTSGSSVSNQMTSPPLVVRADPAPLRDPDPASFGLDALMQQLPNELSRPFNDFLSYFSNREGGLWSPDGAFLGVQEQREPRLHQLIAQQRQLSDAQFLPWVQEFLSLFQWPQPWVFETGELTRELLIRIERLPLYQIRLYIFPQYREPSRQPWPFARAVLDWFHQDGLRGMPEGMLRVLSGQEMRRFAQLMAEWEPRRFGDLFTQISALPDGDAQLPQLTCQFLEDLLRPRGDQTLVMRDLGRQLQWQMAAVLQQNEERLFPPMQRLKSHINADDVNREALWNGLRECPALREQLAYLRGVPYVVENGPGQGGEIFREVQRIQWLLNQLPPALEQRQPLLTE